jgi:hypothetical protein
MAFKAKLFRYPGAGGWTFAQIPERHAPPVTHGWGRTPVLARVDGTAWETSVWRDKTYGTLLAVPKRVRGEKGDGDFVQVELAEPADPTRSAPPLRKVREPGGPAPRATRAGRGR